jgi:hypothetical protein
MTVNDFLESTVQANSFWANPATCSSTSVVFLSIVGFTPTLIGVFTNAFTILAPRHKRPSVFIVCLIRVEHLPAPITGPKLLVSFALTFSISTLVRSPCLGQLLVNLFKFVFYFLIFLCESLLCLSLGLFLMCLFREFNLKFLHINFLLSDFFL